MIQIECNEKGGSRLRTVRPMPRDMATILAVREACKQVPSTLDTAPNPLEILLDPANSFFLVDNVGMLFWHQSNLDEAIMVHVTFWDGRLRGREHLCRVMAEFVREATRKLIYTMAPVGRPRVMEFCKRVGFEELMRTEEYAVYRFNPSYTG